LKLVSNFNTPILALQTSQRNKVQCAATASIPNLWCFHSGGAIMAKRIKITARILPDGQPFTATGQEARTLLLLVQKGRAGVQAYDFRGGPPFRLPAYCWSLIRKHGLAIETVRVPHDGGWHGRFVLHTPVEIISDGSEAAALAVAA
jgi:hypothetical protein